MQIQSCWTTSDCALQVSACLFSLALPPTPQEYGSRSWKVEQLEEESLTSPPTGDILTIW